MARPPKEGLFKQGGSAIWYCRFYDVAGQLQRKSTGKTDQQAALRVYETLRGALVCKPHDKPTVADVLAIYHREKGQYSKRSGYEYARQQLLTWFEGVEWERLGVKGDEHRIQKYIQHRQQQGASAGTINIEVGMLSAAANVAIDDGVDIRNHARGKRLTEQKPNYLWLTPEQAGRLLLACRHQFSHKFASPSPHLFDFVTIALGTGLRLGEILGLQRQQVDFPANCIRIPQTKSGKPHEIAMTDEVRAAVQRCCSRSSARWLFYNPRTDHHLVTISPQFRSACKRADIPITDKKAGVVGIKTYNMRHSFASWLLQAGASLEEVAEVLNHQDPRTTKRYAHQAKGGQKRTLDRLPKL